MTTSVEIKAYCKDLTKLKNIILAIQAKELGTDHQTDTYFHSKSGILKLREGTYGSQLLHYNIESGKQTIQNTLNSYKTIPKSCLKEILEKTIGSSCIVDKERKSYQLENISFHLDSVKGLGDFILIEANDLDGTIGLEQLKGQCNKHLKTLEINAKSIVSLTYQELLQQNNLFNQILVDE